MNFVDLHLGDYEAATAHLSILEDGVYGRMLRIYYRTEKPLPADLKQVCRLVRAVSKPERDAVEQVLADFFTLEADGWHQARCDEELQRYHDGEPEREAKKANEETRLKRHREERAALFKVLTDAGQHAPWNTKIEELRRLAAPYQDAPATPPATKPETPSAPLPATAPATPATATHGNVSPLPTTHYPDYSEAKASGASAPPDQQPGSVGSGEGAPPDTADVIFGLGVPLLTAANVADRNARSMLGLMRKTHGDAAVIAAIQRCASEKPLQPVAWLQAALKAKAPAAAVAKPDRIAMANAEVARRFHERTTT